EKWGVWPWERSRYESLKDALREIDKQIREFQESAAGELEERIREALGIGWRELASGVRSAFGAATLGDFTEAVERELKMRVRNALITAFLESAEIGRASCRERAEVSERGVRVRQSEGVRQP